MLLNMELLEDMTLLLILAVSGVFLYLGRKIFWRCGNLPPGPPPLPLLGNVLKIRGGDIVNSLLKLREKYGDVFTVYMGTRPLVVVTGYKFVKEVYLDKGEDFLNRGAMPVWDVFYKNYGLVYTNNIEWWRDLRMFSHATLKGFGLGKKTNEDFVIQEAQFLVEALRKNKESFCYAQEYLSKATCNIIFLIMFGNRHEYEEKDIDIVLNLVHETFKTASSFWGQLYEMLPGLMRFIPGPHHNVYKSLEKLTQYIDNRVKMNEKTLDPNNPRDFVDVFLIKLEKEKMNPNRSFSMANLLATTLQIFFAGIETTSTTMTYCLLILLKYPDVLAKVNEEIDHVIGRNRSPSFQDRNYMPYTEAMIHETQRFTDLLPMGVPRKTTREVTLKGYTLPKDTDVFPMLTTVLKDPTCFKYPTEFNPENFLNEKGEYQKNSAFMPLAAGKRVCFGESLTRMELFLFLVTILQNFTIKSLIPQEELDISPYVSGLGNFPKPYKVAFIPR